MEPYYLLVFILLWSTVTANTVISNTVIPLNEISSGMPQQIHIALTKDHTEMSATWLTFDEIPQQIQYRKVSTTTITTITAETTKFVNPSKWIRYIHRATMTGLNPGDSYVYQVGRPGFLSKEYTFKQLPLDPPYSILAFGDLGVQNGQSIPYLLEEAQKKTFDLAIHVGDFAYDLFKNNGTVGDQYFNTLQPLIATVPYMVIAGNHEAEEKHEGNFTTYRNSFTMPDEGYGDNQFYSFDVGPIHFIGISSEFYGFYYIHGVHPIFNQYSWLQNDLAEAQMNRDKRPWIITYFHRPFYCSNDDTEQCNQIENKMLRNGLNILNMPGLESIFDENNIDIGFAGHEHSYERFYPRTSNGIIKDDPYTNPDGPIYIVTGSAGCHSPHPTFGDPVPFSAIRNNEYGYSTMFVPNSTHILFQQYSVEKLTIVDSIWISKDVSKNNDKKRLKNPKDQQNKERTIYT